MSDTVKLIIEIDDEDYNSILKTYSLLGDRASSRIDNKLFRAVKNGTILMSVIEDIKAEIRSMPKTYPFVNHLHTYVKDDDVLAIIDKHIGGDEE